MAHGRITITHDMAIEAAKNRAWGNEILCLMQTQERSLDISFDIINAAIQYGSEVTVGRLINILENSGLNLPVESAAVAAARCQEGPESMSLLLTRFGAALPITPEVLHAAARNTTMGDEIVSLLVDTRGDDIHPTAELFLDAASNRGTGADIMEILMERYRDKFQITNELLETAAQNDLCGEDILRILNAEPCLLMTAPLKGRGSSSNDLLCPAARVLIDPRTSHGGSSLANTEQSADPAPDASLEIRTATTPKPDAGNVDDKKGMDTTEEKGLVADFFSASRLPVPTLEGFKAQIMQLNPRLEPALVDRFANEQLRRYKKLVELQQKHVNAIAERCCKAGQYFFAMSSDVSSFQSRQTPADSDAGCAEVGVTDYSQGHELGHAVGEGAIAAGQFPPGVPRPPVACFPSEFECPICFEVRKFHKLSDWSKHVNEDVQPFTCTFPDCAEPKSFKRKADWIRHENERHRQLDWWSCSFAGCTHQVFRKQHFVMHLVRWHMMSEPKVKRSETITASDGPPEIQREWEIKQLWEMVESCRQENRQSPRHEPCRFCGNICGTWKELASHLAKHLEQLAMPVLELAKQSTASSGIPASSAQFRR